MPTIVGILTFISMINTTSERLKAIHLFICWDFSFYEQLKFHAQLSWAWKKFYNLWARLSIPLNAGCIMSSGASYCQDPLQYKETSKSGDIVLRVNTVLVVHLEKCSEQCLVLYCCCHVMCFILLRCSVNHVPLIVSRFSHNARIYHIVMGESFQNYSWMLDFDTVFPKKEFRIWRLTFLWNNSGFRGWLSIEITLVS